MHLRDSENFRLTPVHDPNGVTNNEGVTGSNNFVVVATGIFGTFDKFLTYLRGAFVGMHDINLTYGAANPITVQ
jgi:hypothetical protein